MPLIRLKQIDQIELGTFISGVIISQSGYFYGNTVELTSGVLFQNISYGITYPVAPEINFTIRHPSGGSSILANVLTPKGVSSSNFEFSNFVPSTGYFVDIITTQ